MRYCAKFKSKEIIVLFFLLSGIAYGMIGKIAERYVYMVFAISFFLLLKKAVIPHGLANSLDILFILFIGTFVIDTLLFSNISCLVYGFGMMLSYFSIRACLYPLFEDRLYEVICKTVIAIVLICISFCILLYGIQFSSYQGFWGNPNSYGLFVFEIPTLLLIFMDNEIQALGKIKGRSFFLFLVGIFFVFISDCRTALFANILCLTGFIMINRKSHAIKKLLILLALLILIILLYVIVGKFDITSISMIYKITEIWTRKDIGFFNLREGFWKYIWENTNLFEGTRVFLEAPEHSVYFGLMNMYGKLNAFLFFSFMIVLLIKSYRFAIKSNCKWRCIAFINTLTFMCVSLTENMLMTLPFILMFLSLPSMIGNDGRWMKKYD